MAELAALNVRIQGDASDLRAALQSAEDGLESVAAQAQATTRQVAATSGGMGRLGQTFTQNGFAISNMANQFSDLAVQIGAGVSPARALSQQLPQMTAFMGPLANIIGVASGVLIGLAGNFLLTRNNAQSYEDGLERLRDLQSEFSRANSILMMDLVALGEQYGINAMRVRELAFEQLQLRQIELQDVLRFQVEALTEYARAMATATQGGHAGRNAMTRLQETFGVTGREADRLAQAFRNLAEAPDFEAQQAALVVVRDLLEQAGMELEDFPPALQVAISNMNQLELATIDVQAAADRAANSFRDMSSAFPTFISGAGAGRGAVGMPSGEPILGGGGDAAAVGGGGGGGGAATNPIVAELESLQQSLMTQEELQLASFQRQQEVLQEALNQRLLTQQEYNSLMEQAQAQHQAAMESIDVYRYGSALAQTQQFMGDMAAALQGGNEQMARISRIFAAGEALVNAWRAYSQVIADPSLPFFAKIPAALSVLSAGMGAVNAIKSGSKGTAVAGGAAVVGANTNAAPQYSRNVAIQLTGGDMFSRDQVIQLINSINEAVEDGSIVRLV